MFAAVQLADGAMTAAGVSQYGPHMEGNPLLQLFAEGAGLGVAIVTAKIVAISCATVLHVHARHLTLAILTLAYVVGAIVPWTLVLATP